MEVKKSPLPNLMGALDPVLMEELAMAESDQPEQKERVGMISFDQQSMFDAMEGSHDGRELIEHIEDLRDITGATELKFIVEAYK